MLMQKKLFTAVFVLCLAFASPVFAAIVIPPPTPTLPETKDDCKDGGWQNYEGVFKNQGDCVSFVATEGKNQPDGQ